MRIALALSLTGLAVMACSSSNGNGSQPLASDVSSFADDYCSLLEPCCADAGLSTTGQTCHAFVQLAAGQGTYNPTQGQACIDAMQQASSQPDFCSTMGGSSASSACNDVFGGKSRGTVQPGQPCQSDSDCAPGSSGGAACVFGGGSSGSSTQTCVQTMSGKAGDSPCVGTVNGQVTYFEWSMGTPPDQGYLCDMANGVTCDATTHACTALEDVGQPCSSDTDCVASAYCAFGGGSGSNQCAPRAADGQPCSTGVGSNTCLATSSCDPTTMTCKARLPSGAACTMGSQCQSDFCVNNTCDGSGGSSLGLGLICGQ